VTTTPLTLLKVSWTVGSIASIVIGGVVGIRYGVLGVAVAFALSILVDIRYELEKRNLDRGR